MKYIGIIITLVVVVVIAMWFGGFYNSIVGLNEDVAEQWGNVENAYQLRADKTQNLVETVRGAASFERGTLTDVIEARSRATSVNVTPGDLSPEQVQQFEQAQEQFSGALSRLLVTVERYPELQAVQAFRDFQAQYEGMENRIGVERRKFNEVAGNYNRRVKRFPGNLLAGMFGFEEKGYFEGREGTDVAPTISFE